MLPNFNFDSGNHMRKLKKSHFKALVMQLLFRGATSVKKVYHVQIFIRPYILQQQKLILKIYLKTHLLIYSKNLFYLNFVTIFPARNHCEHNRNFCESLFLNFLLQYGFRIKKHKNNLFKVLVMQFPTTGGTSVKKFVMRNFLLKHTVAEAYYENL